MASLFLSEASVPCCHKRRAPWVASMVHAIHPCIVYHLVLNVVRTHVWNLIAIWGLAS